MTLPNVLTNKMVIDNVATTFFRRDNLLRNSVGRRVVTALCCGTLCFPLVVLAVWAQLPSKDIAKQADLIMSIDMMVVFLTFA